MKINKLKENGYVKYLRFIQIYYIPVIPFKSKIIGIGIAQVDDLGQAKNIIYSVKFKK